MHPAVTFCHTLFGPEAVSIFQTLPEKPECGQYPRTFRGRVEDVLPMLERANALGSAVFVTLHEMRGTRRRAEACTAIRVACVDGDDVDVRNPPDLGDPHVWHKRSDNPRRWACFWRLAEFEDPARWRSLQKALAAHYGGDRAVCDLARVMRLPGFAHWKDGTGHHAYVAFTPPRPGLGARTAYTIDELAEAHGIDPATILADAPAPTAEPLDLDRELPDAERGRLLAKLVRLGTGTSRHNAALGWAMDAVAAGMPMEEVRDLVASWMAEEGRAPADDEVDRMLRAAALKAKAGTTEIRTPGIRPERDFDEILPDDPRLATATEPDLSPEQAKAQEDELQAWEGSLRRTDRGVLKSTDGNADLILRHDPRVRELLRWDDWRKEIAFGDNPPWHRKTEAPGWTDHDDTSLALWISKAYECDFEVAKVVRVVPVVAKRRPFNPVTDYLDGLTWDGTPRLDAWLCEVFGSEDSPYTRSVGAAILIAAVARARDPGCKVDTMLVLEGDQGIGKSTALRRLAGAEVFSDAEIDVANKDAVQQLQGVWIYELGELHALKRAEITQLKAFLSRQVDRQRDPYDRRVSARPRRTVFIGTTNQSHYLTDETGNRRFWPVATTCARPELLEDASPSGYRAQLWAEAAARYARKEPWWLSKDMEKVAMGEQAARFQSDPWEEIVGRWLVEAEADAGLDGVAFEPSTTTIAQAALGLGNKVTPYDGHRIGAVMRRLGWRISRPRVEGQRLRIWARMGADHAS